MKKILFSLCLIIFAMLIFCACGESKPDASGDGGEKVKVIEQIEHCTLVRADKASDSIKGALTKLHTAIADATGSRLSVGTDWTDTDESEIIIGNADRTACAEAEKLLKSDFDYIIKASGQEIVIMGLTDDSTIKAVDYFIENFIKDGKVCFPTGDGVLYAAEMQLDSFVICGIDISEFKFHYIEANGLGGQSTYDEVNAIAERLGNDYTGKKLPITPDDIKKDSMIYFDRSGLDYEKGGIKVEDGDLYFYGSYHSIGQVVDHFFNNVIGSNTEIEFYEGFSVEISTDDLPSVYSKDDLMKVLEHVYNTRDLLIVGEEVNNSRQMPSTMLKYYKYGNDGTDGKVPYPGTDTYPALMGLDLGRCGYKMPTLPEDQWMIISQMICETIDYAADGGIVTIGNHMTNPNPENIPEGASEERGDLGDEQAWIDLITEGTPSNERFRSELELNAIVLQAFEDAGVPIIWRPFHECNGGWFWWTPELGSTQFDSKYFVDMWVYVYNFFTEEKGLSNLIWEYSPSTSTHMDIMYLYPGDDYCDIVGVDWYTSGNFEIADTDGYARLMETGKVTNLAEIGPGSSLMAQTQEEQEKLYTAEELIGNAYSMYYEDYQIGYFMTYSGRTTLMWLPGGEEVMKDDRVLDLSEMLPLFEKVTGFKP